VVTALAPALTRRVVHLAPATRPPGIDAYRAYVEGMERFVAGEWVRALEHFAHCRTLAPGYALPRIVSAIAYWNLGQLHEARAVAREADALRTTLGRFERAVLDMVLAWLAGDWAAAHRAVAVQAEMAPGSIPHFQVAEELRRLNYPRRARDVLLRLDPGTGELRGWIFYWNELVTSYHMLHDHERELQAATHCRELHPHVPLAALLEVRALAALGRVGDATRVVEHVLASPAGHTRAAPELLIEAALELRAHGSPDAAAALLERAVEWCRPRTDGSDDTRRALGRALYHAGMLDEAHDIFEQLAGSSAGRVQPVGMHHMHLGAHLDEGYLAAIAARRSDKPALQRLCTHLRQLDTPFLYGAQWYWLAVVAAINIDRNDVVRMLGRAFADGMAMESFVHTDPHLELVRDEPRVAALLRPRG
jgi:tetratricopeptide (TPR) repeat protein